MYRLRENKKAMMVLDELFLTFLEENILCKNTDSYSFGEKIEEVEKSPDESNDLLSLHGIPLHLVSLTFDNENFLVDNKFLKKVPYLKEIMLKLEECAKNDIEAKDAIRQIAIEMKKANIIY